TAEIVRDLRSFSRLDEADFKMADVHEALNATLTLLSSRLRDRVEVIKDYGELPLIECAIGQINQVLMNILTNAIQAMGDSGTLTIRTQLLEGARIQIAVRDTGPGIDESVRARIFDPFFTTKPTGEGTGLGLSISHGIIERHGGEIEVHSEPGQGSEFVVTLPVRAEPPEGEE
ncbi:MAG: ATP-binding protein, partial [Gemmatimonadota bacterium]